jgi:predicted nucleic acid-binding Zn ribbon protein
MSIPHNLPPKKHCSQCGHAAPTGVVFCGMCGAKLDGTVPLLSKDSNERRMLEIEIAEVVVDRLVKWGKLLGGRLIAACAIAGLGIGFWGFKSLSDVKTELVEISAQTKSEALRLKKEVDSASSEVSDLNKQYGALNGDLERYRLVNHTIERLQKDLQTVNGQIASWYGSLETELFDSSSAGSVHFIPMTAAERTAFFSSHGGNNEDPRTFFTAVVTLKKTPIPASVKIIRYNLEIPSTDIKVAGRQVSFVTPSDKFDATTDNNGQRGAPIYVQYHPVP